MQSSGEDVYKRQARHLGILGIIQAQHGRDGLLVRIAVIRCKTIAADTVHHAAVVRPVHIAACPRLNVRAVRENVRHTFLHAVPVSYTHLDVYKRQSTDNVRVLPNKERKIPETALP